jgi:hypothetical protein
MFDQVASGTADEQTGGPGRDMSATDVGGLVIAAATPRSATIADTSVHLSAKAGRWDSTTSAVHSEPALFGCSGLPGLRGSNSGSW